MCLSDTPLRHSVRDGVRVSSPLPFLYRIRRTTGTIFRISYTGYENVRTTVCFFQNSYLWSTQSGSCHDEKDTVPFAVHPRCPLRTGRGSSSCRSSLTAVLRVRSGFTRERQPAHRTRRSVRCTCTRFRIRYRTVRIHAATAQPPATP